MTLHLFLQAIMKTLSGVVLLGLLLFLPAGTWDYPNAWLLMGVLFLPMLIVGAVLMLKSPTLLEKRLHTKETESKQKLVIGLSVLMFVSGFLLAGFDFRFAWFPLPQWISYAAAGVFLLGYIMYAEVMRENAYLSRTVEVQENQKVIDTGLYGIVRHPMYSATVLIFLTMPLILGSLVAFAVFLLYLPIIVLRIKNEEKVLEEGLDGYLEYKEKVKYRLIPFVW